MNQYKKRWQLKNAAKDKLVGNYSEAVLLTMIYGVFLIANSVINTFVMYYSPDKENVLLSILLAEITPTGYVMGLGISLVLGILLNMLKAGVSLFYLNMACGQSYSIRDLFQAFREHPSKYLLVSLVILLVQFFFALPGYACDYFYLMNPSDQWMVLSYICRIVGQIIVLPFTLAWAQSFRLLLDYPSVSAVEALRKSRQLMKGHKGRLFVLQLSFLPLEIAAIFTIGIGYLWLSPYINMTYTLFYLDLMNPQEA
ncbi:MAG: DUF975 family protein [Lachnospiraceae bacterium]|nr:DUF975 family protein [Lachnospiraceae bacterium]